MKNRGVLGRLFCIAGLLMVFLRPTLAEENAVPVDTGTVIGIQNYETQSATPIVTPEVSPPGVSDPGTPGKPELTAPEPEPPEVTVSRDDGRREKAPRGGRGEKRKKFPWLWLLLAVGVGVAASG